MTRVHLVISGDVQGVGFRSWVKQKAKQLCLTGWVKNRQDDAVELVAEGQKNNLEQLTMLCRKGPEIAWVKNVVVQWQEATSEFVGFEVIY